MNAGKVCSFLEYVKYHEGSEGITLSNLKKNLRSVRQAK